MPDLVLEELLTGRGAHADPIACVSDLNAELAGREQDGFPYTIFQLAAHMNYWMDFEWARILGERPNYPDHASESWTASPAPAAEKEWKTTVDKFSENIARFRGLAQLDSEDLARELPPLAPSQSRRENTVLAAVWQIAAHNSYHTGQIALLRRVLGAWPPPAGGDTW